MKGIRRKKAESRHRQDAVVSNEYSVSPSDSDFQTEIKNLQLIEARYRHIFEEISSGLILLSSNGQLEGVNKAALKMLGIRLDELRDYIEGASEMDTWLTSDFKGEFLPKGIFPWGVLTELNRSEKCFQIQFPGESTRWIKSFVYPIRQKGTGQIENVIITLEDVTEQKIYENHEIVLKELTHLVLRQKPLSEIMNYLCNSLVNTLGYTSACIGIKSPDGRILFPHRVGLGTEVILQAKIRWDDTPEGQGAMGTAIRTGKSQCDRIIGNKRFALWQDFYVNVGVNSIGVIPLLEGTASYGVLALYSGDENCFTAQRMSLLEHFGNEVSMALTAAKNQEQMEYYQLLAEESQEIIYFIDENRKIVEANRMTENTYGYAREELLGMDIMQLRAPETKEEFYPTLKTDTDIDIDIDIDTDTDTDINTDINELFEYETMHIRKDGTKFWVEIAATTANLHGKTVLMVHNRDMTQRKKTLELLSASETRYREIMENMTNAVIAVETKDSGKNFVLTELNKAAENLEHFHREEVIGQTLEKLFPKSFDLHKVVHQVWRTKKHRHFTLKVHEAKRGWSIREMDIFPLPSGEIVGIYQDVTREKRAEEALWVEKERAQVTLGAIGDAVLTVGLDQKIEYMNPVAEEMTGWKLSEARGLSLDVVLNLETNQGDYIWDHPVARCLRENDRVQEELDALLRHRNGERFAVEALASPLRNELGKLLGAVLVIRNITQQKELMQQLMYQAHHDPLTGLPNRLAFQDRLGVAIAQAHRKQHGVAVLFLDIDHFKLVNDSYGHAVGDQVLFEIASLLRSTLREGDTVSRRGGDEFIILLPEVYEAIKVANVAMKILSVISKPLSIGSGIDYTATVSIGISLYPQDGDNVDTLVKHADIAMYQAKSLGRNNYQFFTAELSNVLKQQFSLQANLRRALDRKEFVLHYQPIYDLQNQEILGAEALIRWQTPNGLIPPIQFIPIAEETGLIIPLGEWVIGEACRQACQWKKMGLTNLYVAVNLSARQIKQPNLVHIILEILKETGLDAASLQLEITESVAAEDIELTAEVLYELKKSGIRISIDDFGTGFSSLNYLHRLPFDTLKIDKSFVMDLDTRSSHQIVQAILGLAKNLDMKVIAEGVETKAQLNYLQETSCQAVQGYYISRPLSAQNFLEKCLSIFQTFKDL
jgi:diguanylate cyclase (GGDEF)-like protein/PAS domain S-box-containing protein